MHIERCHIEVLCIVFSGPRCLLHASVYMYRLLSVHNSMYMYYSKLSVWAFNAAHSAIYRRNPTIGAGRAVF